MKKFAIIVFVFVIIICGISYVFLNYKNMYKNSKISNFKYEQYLNKEITGNELVTVINMAIDNNEKNKVEKDKKGIYIENETNSIKIEIKISDNDTIYNMEAIYNKGTQNFIQYYGEVKFKCVDIKYHTNTNKVKYMLFEQE